MKQVTSGSAFINNTEDRSCVIWHLTCLQIKTRIFIYMCICVSLYGFVSTSAHKRERDYVTHATRMFKWGFIKLYS